MIYFKGKFKLNWETSLPSFLAVDAIDYHDYNYASERVYSVSWLGIEASYHKQVNRPLALAKTIEPWAWIDSIFSYFRK
jgi:hypothetical protein